MSEQQLDEQALFVGMARLMGFVPVNVPGGRGVVTRWRTPDMPAQEWLPSGPPLYPHDRGACALAEQRMVDAGWGQDYSDELLTLMRRQPGVWPSWKVWLTAPADIRCQAMLTVWNAKKDRPE